MALIRLWNVGVRDIERLMEKGVIDPGSHVVVVSGNRFTLVPIKTSRHKHYVVFKAKREESKEVYVKLAKSGFLMLKGYLKFVEVR